MPIAPGDHLGPYDILSPLGAGGMGEVYRARDTKLNRDVAIKVLPAGLGNDADYLARFQREAQALAALHHPNIATIFGLEQNAIVMELVEGQNPKGPLPLTDALNIARQIAEALEAAHDKGIIHRDLKPGNVIVTPEGVVKVLDFGLAKTAEKSAGPTTADSPTLTMRATEAGLILGTAGYMSPEQAAGKPVDRRADIWSFGVVLHELVTGKRLFDGETVSHTLAHVLTADVDLTKVPAGPIRDLVRRCLDRNLKSRLRDIGEARIAIESYLAHPPQESQPAPTQSSRRPWAVAAVLLLTTIAGWGLWLRKPAPPLRSIKLEVSPPPGIRFSDISRSGLAIAPDGQTLAFVARNAKGDTLLYVRSVESLEVKALPESQGAETPFWSPDSKSLAFVAGGKLKRVELAGGSPVALCDARSGRGGSWNDEGVILFAQQQAGLQRVSASGGTPATVTRLNIESGESAHYYPQYLAGGNQFLYLLRHADREKTGIYVGSPDGKPPTQLLQTRYRAVYDAGSGWLLYIEGNGNLMARRLELNPPRLTGEAVAVAEQVDLFSDLANANVSVSNTGTLFFAREQDPELQRFGWRDRAGKLLQTIGQPVQNGGDFVLSPDGSRVAYERKVGGDDELFAHEFTRDVDTQVTFSSGSRHVRWSADGKHLYYYRNSRGLYRKPADGSGDEEMMVKGSGAFPMSATPDGRYLLYRQSGPAGGLLSLPLEGGRRAEKYLEGKFLVGAGATFAPDGRWVAYASFESGRSEVYVQGFPEHRGKWLVSVNGGSAPQWRWDGKELYWISPDGNLMAASVELSGSGVRVGRAEPLFRLTRGDYQPTRDGRRFLVWEPEGDPTADRPMVVILNWAAGLGNYGRPK